MVSTVEAKNGNELPNRVGENYAYNNAVNFIERGIEFHVFTNGEFDFNSNYNDVYYDYNGRRRTRTKNFPVTRDYRGRVNTIGNASINYDRHGNVTRIGNVFMRYHRGRLTNVGSLSVRYDRGGYPIFNGNVKNNFHRNNGIQINIGNAYNYDDAYFYRKDFNRNYSKTREDKNFYYYKAKPNSKIGKKNKILKRRKPVAKKIAPRVIKKRVQKTYRKTTPKAKSGKKTQTTRSRRK